jgi:hypothetical protein
MLNSGRALVARVDPPFAIEEHTPTIGPNVLLLPVFAAGPARSDRTHAGR